MGWYKLNYSMNHFRWPFGQYSTALCCASDGSMVSRLAPGLTRWCHFLACQHTPCLCTLMHQRVPISCYLLSSSLSYHSYHRDMSQKFKARKVSADMSPVYSESNWGIHCMISSSRFQSTHHCFDILNLHTRTVFHHSLSVDSFLWFNSFKNLPCIIHHFDGIIMNRAFKLRYLFCARVDSQHLLKLLIVFNIFLGIYLLFLSTNYRRYNEHAYNRPGDSVALPLPEFAQQVCILLLNTNN